MWCATTDALMIIFFFIPAYELIQAVRHPMVQENDKLFVSLSTIGLILYTLIFSFRFVYNLLIFFNSNKIYTWILNQQKKEHYSSLIWFEFCFYFVLDFFPSMIFVFAVFQFERHDLTYEANPYNHE